jgi:hypothetical protein
VSFMSEPAKVLRSYLQGTPSEDRWYQYGMLAMSLELITRIKVLEELPVTTEVGRQEAITVLHTMLTELGISELAYDWYEKLDEARKPKFRPVPDVYERLEQQLLHAEPSDVPGGPLRPSIPRSHASLLASESEGHLPELSRLAPPDVLAEEHQSPDASTTSELGGRSVVIPLGKRIE